MEIESCWKIRVRVFSHTYILVGQSEQKLAKVKFQQVRIAVEKAMIKVTIGVLIRRPIEEDLVVDETDKGEWTNMKIIIGEVEKSIEEIFYY